MNHTEAILEFDKIKQLWESLALTKWAKQEIADVQPCMNEARLQAMLKDTAEAKAMLEKCGNPPLSAMEGILELIATAQKGGCLSGAELLRHRPGRRNGNRNCDFRGAFQERRAVSGDNTLSRSKAVCAEKRKRCQCAHDL